MDDDKLLDMENEALVKTLYSWEGTRHIFATDEVKEIHLSRLDLRLMLGLDEARDRNDDLQVMDVDIIGEAPKSILQLSMTEQPQVDNLLTEGIVIIHIDKLSENESELTGSENNYEHRIIASPHKLYMPEDCQNLFTPSSFVTVGAPDRKKLDSKYDDLEKYAIRNIKLKNVSFENTTSAREMFYAMPLLRRVEIEDCHFSCVKDIRGLVMGCQLLGSVRIVDSDSDIQNMEAPKTRSINAEYMITDTFGSLRTIEINCLDPDNLVKTTGPVILWNYRRTSADREIIIKAPDKLRSYLLKEAIVTKDTCIWDVLAESIEEVGDYIHDKDLSLGKLEGYKYLMMRTNKFKVLERLKAEANEYKMCVRRAIWWQMLMQADSNVIKLLDDLRSVTDILETVAKNKDLKIDKFNSPEVKRNASKIYSKDIAPYGTTIWSNKLSIRRSRFVIGEKFGDATTAQVLRTELLSWHDYTGEINNSVELLELANGIKYDNSAEVFRTFKEMYSERVYIAILTNVICGDNPMNEVLAQISNCNPGLINAQPYREEMYADYRPSGSWLMDAKQQTIARNNETPRMVTAEEEVPLEVFSMYRKYVETTLALLSVDEKDADLSLKGLIDRLMNSIVTLAEQFRRGELEEEVYIGLTFVNTMGALKQAFLYLKRAQLRFKTTIEPNARRIAKYDADIDKYISDKRKAILAWYNEDSIICKKRGIGSVGSLSDKLASIDHDTDEYKDAEHFMIDILTDEISELKEVKERRSQYQDKLNKGAGQVSIDELLATEKNIQDIEDKINDAVFFDALAKEAKQVKKPIEKASSSGASSLLDDIEEVDAEKTAPKRKASARDDSKFDDKLAKLSIVNAVSKICPYCYGPIEGNRCSICHDLIDVKATQMRLKQFMKEAKDGQECADIIQQQQI